MKKITFLMNSLRSYLRDTQGSVVVLTALMAPVMIGGVGLGVETGHWYQKQRHLQHLADITAHSATARLRAGDSIEGIRAAAEAVAEASGFEIDLGTIEVYSPPLSGTLLGDADSVEVVLTETRRRWFSAIYRSDSIVLQGRAVSRIVEGRTACILALSENDWGAVYVTGSTQIDLTNCVVASNSVSSMGFKMSGDSAALTVDCVYSVGGAVITSNLTLTECTAVKTYAPVNRDPYADIPEPANTGQCRSSREGQNHRSTVITPTDSHPNGMNSRRYCGGLSLKGDIYFDPGLYIIDGGTFTINTQSKVYSNAGGVTFYLVNGATLKINGGAEILLKAPNSGPTSGMLFFGSRSSGVGGSGSCNRNYGTEHKLNGGSDLKLTGAIYLPKGDLIFNGNSSSQNGCTQIVANTIQFSGNSSLSADCTLAGTQELVANEMVQLQE